MDYDGADYMQYVDTQTESESTSPRLQGLKKYFPKEKSKLNTINQKKGFFKGGFGFPKRTHNTKPSVKTKKQIMKSEQNLKTTEQPVTKNLEQENKKNNKLANKNKNWSLLQKLLEVSNKLPGVKASQLSSSSQLSQLSQLSHKSHISHISSLLSSISSFTEAYNVLTNILTRHPE